MDLEECTQITDQTLLAIATGCPSLEKLTLSHCELITDDGIRNLAAGRLILFLLFFIFKNSKI